MNVNILQNGSDTKSRSSSRLDPDLVIEPRRVRRNSLDLLSIDDDLDLNIPLGGESKHTEICHCFPVALDTGYDVLCDSRTFQVHFVLLVENTIQLQVEKLIFIAFSENPPPIQVIITIVKISLDASTKPCCSARQQTIELRTHKEMC